MTVLIVDDDIATADAIRDTVHWQELSVDTVLTAYNMSQAQKLIAENRIDLIISDIEMPQGSGIDLLSWFRQEKKEGEFIFLTCQLFDFLIDICFLHFCIAIFQLFIQPFKFFIDVIEFHHCI